MNTTTTSGDSARLIAPSGRHLVTSNIEEMRLEQEEKLAGQGWEFGVRPWHEAHDTVSELTRGLRLGADAPYPGATDLGRDLVHISANLTREEGERSRKLGRLPLPSIDSVGAEDCTWAAWAMRLLMMLSSDGLCRLPP